MLDFIYDAYHTGEAILDLLDLQDIWLYKGSTDRLQEKVSDNWFDENGLGIYTIMGEISSDLNKVNEQFNIIHNLVKGLKSLAEEAERKAQEALEQERAAASRGGNGRFGGGGGFRG